MTNTCRNGKSGRRHGKIVSCITHLVSNRSMQTLRSKESLRNGAPKLQRAHVDAAQAINAGYQSRFQRPVTYADLRNFPHHSVPMHTMPRRSSAAMQPSIILMVSCPTKGLLVCSMPYTRRPRGRSAAAAAAQSSTPPSKAPPSKHRSSAANRPPEKPASMTRKMTLLGLC